MKTNSVFVLTPYHLSQNRYVQNNPLIYVDPSGHRSKKAAMQRRVKYFQDTWKDTYSEIDSNTAILATLFNIGHEATTPNQDPQSNYFGDFAEENL